MSTISATEVKRLRDQTGAGMMDCKAALTEANGDFEAATVILRKKGLASAARKAGRTTGKGVIGSWLAPDRMAGVLVEVNCETDFVARTDDFQQLVANVLAEIVKAGDKATPEWLTDPAGPIAPLVAAMIGKAGENMAVSRFVRYAGHGAVAQYIHLGGELGVQVELSASPAAAAHPEFATMAREIAMQIAAVSPQYASRAAVPSDLLDKERSIYRAQMESSGKPPQVIDKIVEGKLGSFYEQVVLVDQPSIRDPKMKVSDVIAAAARAIGESVSVTRFARLKVGETA